MDGQRFDCVDALRRLIDREAGLLNRGRAEKSLEGLRRRLSNMFLQLLVRVQQEAARSKGTS